MAGAFAIFAVFVALALPAAAGAASAPGFDLVDASVAPRRAFVDGVRPLSVRIRFRADGPSDLSIRIRRGGDLVQRAFVRDLEPGRHRIAVWDGILGSGKVAKEGDYRAFVKPARRRPSSAGRFRLYRHLFPVRGRHGVRGPLGEFGAERSGGRVHEGFDVVAACGTPLVAARGGRVTDRGFDRKLYGNFVEIKGRKDGRSYLYAHMLHPAEQKRGERVKTGERLGEVGSTGNARNVGCQLHFEIHRHGHAIDPEPELRYWDSYS